MLSSIVSFLLSLISRLVAIFYDIFFAPVYALMVLVFPDMTIYENLAVSFLVNRIAPGICFAREVFLNVTGYPRSLLYTLVLIYTAKISYHLAILPVKFFVHLVKSLPIKVPFINS